MTVSKASALPLLVRPLHRDRWFGVMVESSGLCPQSIQRIDKPTLKTRGTIPFNKEGPVSGISEPGGYLGYVAGVAGLIGGLFPLFAPLFVVRSLGGVLSVLWVLIAGIMLLKSR